MNINLKMTTKVEEAAGFMADSILSQLKTGRQVLFFVTGGSSIAVGAKVSELLRNSPERNLIKNITVMMTDERYGPLDHPDSNWYQQMQKGFSLPGAKLIPILDGSDRASTTLKFNANLSRELMDDKEKRYKIGLFGIGADGHTSGILPGSEAVNSEDLAYGYDTPTFSRVTITPKVIEKLDEVVVWVQGKEKWGVVKDLLEKDIEILKQPAQILKKVPILTIFSDYDGKR
ncbi:MAG: 6-phosphogluconolactonase [Candidatus Pacebacteria bacterium]|nr:6-phosphogluconolactonase [Candidatus Paceibacterota bacterium]